MDELRFARREDDGLIVVNSASEELRLLVDDTLLSELKHMTRRDRPAAGIRPREIQALLRAGKSRAQVAAETGLEEADVERYEEPVIAERAYILELAQAVTVRADADVEIQQHFGSVIEQRLRSLDAEASEWISWREQGADWMVGVEFISRESAHRAVWSFDHRKSVLSPITPDAVNLSKQGEVGDRLIPKLRAVGGSDDRGGFDAAAFDDADAVAADDEDAPAPSGSVDDPDLEYERRREIDHLAVSTDEPEGIDLSQTADLLDALRKRRGERERELEEAAGRHPSAYAGAVREDADEEDAAPGPALWSVGGLATEQREQVEQPEAHEEPEADHEPDEEGTADPERSSAPETSRKGRASVPSWDDILFGTRSEDDPA